jgi:hypothetical protein
LSIALIGNCLTPDSFITNQRNLLLEANADLNPNQAVNHYSLNPHEIACHFRPAEGFGFYEKNP